MNKYELSLTRVNERGELQSFEQGKWHDVVGYFAHDASVLKVSRLYRGNIHRCSYVEQFIFILKRSLI